MDDFFACIIGTLIMVGALALGIWVASLIGESDLPFWVKFWLLR